MEFLKKGFILFIVFLLQSSLLAQFKTSETVQGFVVEFNFSQNDIRLDTLVQDKNFSLSIQFPDGGLKAIDRDLLLPVYHFSSILPQKNSLYTVKLEVDQTISIPLSSHFIDVLDSLQNFEMLGYDNVFGIPTMEWNFYPVLWDKSTSSLKLILKGKIYLSSQVPISRKIQTHYKINSRIKKRLKARLHNFPFFEIKYQPGFYKVNSSANYDFSNGFWFKLQYSKESIYRVSLSDLKNNGYNGDIVFKNQIRLFSYQGEDLPVSTSSYPEGLLELPVFLDDKDHDGIWDDNEYVYFYTQPGNHYEYNKDTKEFSFKEYYFDNKFYVLLNISETNGLQIDTLPSLSVSNAQEIHSTLSFYHHERSINNILSGGLEWYDYRFNGTSDQKTVEFTLEDPIVLDSSVACKIRLKGGYGSFWSERTLNVYNFNITLNGNPIASNISFSRNNAKEVSLTFPASYLKSNNTLQLIYSSNYSSSYAYFDYMDLQYYTPLQYDGKFRKIISPPKNGAYVFFVNNIEGSLNDYILFMVLDPFNYKLFPFLIQNNSLVFVDTLESNIPHQYVLVAKQDAEKPENIRLISSHPNVRDPFFSADILIITPPEWYTIANQLKEIYQSRSLSPLTARVVTTEDIYLEFSSGSIHPLALRNYIRFLALNAQSPPSYVILFGNGHFDYKNILYNQENFIPPYEKETNYELTTKPLDNLLTDLYHSTSSLNSVIPDIPIGRIPANSLEEAENYAEKLWNYETLSPDVIIENEWRRKILLVADDEVSTFDKHEYYHLGYSEELISNGHIPQTFDILKVYLTDYPLATGGLGRSKPEATEDLIEKINSGVMLINYFGHGSPTTWAHETVFTIDRDRNKIQNEFKNPIIIAGTCDFGTFDQPNHPSASVELINMKQRGAIAVLSASRPSFAFGNRALVSNFFSNFFHKSYPPGTETIGDAFIRAMNSIGGGDNAQNYNILGSPLIQPIMNAYNIQLDSLSEDTLKALSVVHFKARVTDSAGSTIANFNGKTVLLLRDAYSDTMQSGTYYYQYPGPSIFKGIYTVTNGKIEGDFIIPKSIKYKNDPSGKILFYAIGDQSNVAIGSKGGLLIYGSVQGVKDTRGPEIKLQFKENPNFVDGDILPSTSTLLLELFDEHGINTTKEVGHEIALILDETRQYDLTEFFIYKENNYKEGIIEYPMPPLTTGRHTMKIRVWDNLNNVSETTIHFEIISTEGDPDALVMTHVVNYPNPMTNDTYFTFSLLNPEPQATVTINIYTILGRLIKKIKTSLASPQGFQKIYWDGYDDNGNKLANGVYLYKITVDNGVKKVSKIEKLMILN